MVVESTPMWKSLRCACFVFLILLVDVSVCGQPKRESSTLVVEGQPGEALVLEINGKPYVDLRSLAEITNASLSFKSNRIVLTLPSSSSGAASPEIPAPAPVSGLSQEFMKAGIEAIALMREWASPLAYAIQNNYQVTEDWVANYREQAATGLRTASAAASTAADANALQLLNNEFEAVRQWSDKLVQAKKSMDTAKYSLSPEALRNDPASQKIITCGRFLATMLGSSTFQDNPSCH
jgi:hypothetical protein